jgi:hypothetical protein
MQINDTIEFARKRDLKKTEPIEEPSSANEEKVGEEPTEAIE